KKNCTSPLTPPRLSKLAPARFPEIDPAVSGTPPGTVAASKGMLSPLTGFTSPALLASTERKMYWLDSKPRMPLQLSPLLPEPAPGSAVAASKDILLPRSIEVVLVVVHAEASSSQIAAQAAANKMRNHA